MMMAIMAPAMCHHCWTSSAASWEAHNAVREKHDLQHDSPVPSLLSPETCNTLHEAALPGSDRHGKYHTHTHIHHSHMHKHVQSTTTFTEMQLSLSLSLSLSHTHTQQNKLRL